MNTVGTLTIEMAANIVRLQQDMKKVQSTVEDSMGSVEKSIKAASNTLTAFVAGFSIQQFVGKVIEVQREFDVLNSSLITVTGSARAAEMNFAWIKTFAANTPYSLSEVTGAFTKLKAMGLDPSEEALRSYGNTASAMGKSLNQMIEAVADAATGEFERLKEFGIKASSEGDRVTLTFRGVSETIGKNAAEIEGYLRRIGEVDFAGAMETRAKTLDGAISNLGDTWNQTFLKISQGLFGDALIGSVKLLTSGVESMGNGVVALGAAIQANRTQLLVWAGIFTGGALIAALPAITAAVGALTAGVVALSAAFAANPVALAIMAVTAAAIPAVNAISNMVAANKAAEAATKGVYESEQQRAAFMEANASPAQERAVALTKEQVKEIEKQEEAYQKLIGKLREANAELLLEEANNGKLTTAQKTALDVMIQIQNGSLKLTEARKLEIVEILRANIALEDEATKRAEAKKAAEEQEKQYTKLTEAIRSNIAQTSSETGALSTLTEGQKAALKILEQYSGALGTMTDERKAEVAEMLNQMISEKDLSAAMKASDITLATYQRTRSSQITELGKSTIALDAEIIKQSEANEMYGASATAIKLLEIAKLEEKAMSMDRAAQLAIEADFDAETAEQYRLQAERLRTLAGLKQEGIHVQIAKDSATEWKKTTEELSKGLTDALMRGFESGKGFFENLLDVMRNRFKAFVAESIIKPFMDAIAQGITALTSPITSAIRSVVGSVMSSIGLGGSAAAPIVAAGGGAAAAGGAGAAIAAGGAGGAGAAATSFAAGGAAELGGLAVLGEGAGAAAAAGGAASSLGGALAAAAPVAAVLAGAYLLTKALDGGETRAGGRYSWAPGSGLNFEGGPSGGEIQPEAIRSQVENYAQMINNALAEQGSGLKVQTLSFGLESSKNGKGGTYVGGTLSNGQNFGDEVSGPWNYSETLTADQAWSQFMSELQFALVDAQNVAFGRARGSSPGATQGSGAGALEMGGETVAGFATGTNFVPQDMVAMIHKGEAIVPRQYNPAIGGENVVAAEIRSLRDEVTMMRAETRSTAINTSKMARLQDNWDVRGLTVKTDADQPLETVAA
jgi:hypothetical protein